MTWKECLPIIGITRTHEDIMLARTGDAAALYRVRQRAAADPDDHARVMGELGAYLRDRWRHRTSFDEAEAFSIHEQNESVEPLLRIYV